MTLSYLSIAFVTFTLVVCSVGILGIWVPAMLRSMFRYRLWQLRDKIVDEIAAGDLPDNAYVRRLIHLTECFIIASREVTLFRWTVGFHPPKSVVKDVSEEMQRELEEMSKADRERSQSYYRVLRRLVVQHLVFGAPSGWTAFMCIGIGMFLIALVVGLIELVRRNVSPIQFAIRRCWQVLRDHFEGSISTWASDEPDGDNNHSHRLVLSAG